MTTATPNIFPIITASTTDAEMLRLLRNPEIAIGFALEHLQPWELGMFFRDWKDDADMTGWLTEWREEQGRAEEEGAEYRHDRLAMITEDDQAAFIFARDYLRPHEAVDFMKDRQEGGDLMPWLQKADARRAEQDEAEAKAPFEPDYSDLRAFNRSLAAQRKQRKAQQQ